MKEKLNLGNPVSLKKENPDEKITVYELDFCDTKLIDPNLKVIIDWIQADVSGLVVGEIYDCTITVNEITRKELNELPEWA